MMTTSHETITDTTYRGHEATIGALQTWADGVQKFCGWLPTRDAKVPSAAEVVDHYFNFVEHVLETQREFIKNLLVATNTAYPAHGADKDHVDKNYADKDYADKDYPDKNYPDKNYPDKNYADKNYPDKNYADKDYAVKDVAPKKS